MTDKNHQDNINQFLNEEKLDFIINNKPDRGIYIIDIENLPVGKAEEYIRKIIEKIK